MKVKKLIVSIVGIVIVAALAAGFYYYKNVPKFEAAPVLSRAVEGDGKPVGVLEYQKPYYYASQTDTKLYASIKVNSPFVSKVRIRWYKEPFDSQSRIHVDEDLPVSKSGYAVSLFEVPEGLPKGNYQVSVYVNESDVVDGFLEFVVK